MTTTTKGERRGKSRKRPISLVYVELAGGNGGMMKDLSPEGFSIRAMMPLRLGEKNPFTFSLSETVRIEGEGQVIWVEEHGRVAGIQFARISASAHEQIQSWLIRPETAPKREQVGGTTRAIRDTTIEQLRQELHTTPPRDEAPAPVERPAPPVVERAAPPVTEAPLARMVVQHEPPVIEEPAAVSNKPPEPTAPLEAALPPIVEAPAPRAIEPSVAPPLPAPVAEAAAQVPPVIPAPTPASEPVFAQAPPTVVEAPPVKVLEERPATKVPAAQSTAAPVAGAPVEENGVPALPRLRLDPPTAEPQSKPTEFVPPSFPFSPSSAANKREKWPLHVTADPQPESQPPEAAHTMPDISSVLIQPSASSSHALHAASFDAISSWDGEMAPRESRGISVSGVFATMTVLALLAALYVFHQEVGQSLIWLGQTMGGAFQSNDQKTAAADSSSDSTGNSSGSQNASDTPRDSGQEPTSAAQGESGSNKAGAAGTENTADAAAPIANPAAVSPPAPSPVTNANSAPPVTPLSGMPPSSSPSAPVPEPGQMEYSEAMQILRGKNANNAQLTEVSRLLWVSVEKGNPNAELALAEMYWEGRGVARNCDQTHVLLTAAARKGSVEAQKRLQEFERQGCE
jgi:PilZ domain